MFTGIVEEVGVVSESREGWLKVRAGLVMEGMKLGDSIAVDGTCLTVVARTAADFSVELSPETLRRTTLGDLSVGDHVNLERPLAVSDRLGGHIVQGHIDGTGRIISVRTEGDCVLFRVRHPKRLTQYVVEKGFVAVDGISLTVVKKGTSSFTLSIIPYTLKHTSLRDKTVGHRVNLEADIVAKYIESLLSAQSAG